MQHTYTDEDELRLMGLAAPAVLTLLRKREKSVLGRLYSAVRNTPQDVSLAAHEWAAYVDLIRDFESKLRDREKNP